MNELDRNFESPISEPEPEPDPLLGRFVDLITNPSRLMDNVGRRTRLWAPYLLIFVAMTGFMWMITPIMGPEQLEMSKDSKLMQLLPPEALEEQYEQALNPTPMRRLLGSIQGGFFVIIQSMLLGLLLGWFAKLSGGKGRVVQAMGITAWAAIIPMVIGTLLTLPIILKTESFFGTTIGLAALLPDGDPGSLIFKLLYMLGDFFTWWGVALLVIGFKRVYGLSTGAAATTVILVWVIAILVASAPMLFLM